MGTKANLVSCAPVYNELTYRKLEFLLKMKRNVEFALKSDDFLLKNGRLFCYSRYGFLLSSRSKAGEPL